MRILLLRHGQTHANVDGSLDTAPPGLDLTELGRAQAVAAAKALAGRGLDAVFVSCLARTRQTAAPVLGDLGVEPVVVDGLREISAGDLEMRSDEEARQEYLSTIASWLFGSLEERMPGGETGTEFLARYDAAIEEVAASGARFALVVSHGAAIRTWVGARALDDGSRAWEDVALEPMINTGGIELERAGDRWRILAWNNHPIGGDYLADPTAQDPTGRAPLGE
jgi:probable phosphoglycerate mutase